MSYIVADKVWVIFLNAVIKYGYNWASTSDTPTLVNLNDVHVQATVTMLSTYDKFSQPTIYC